ncbi:hypothetical protein EV14_0523 [Prochlorococcus sp. MIT 0703]|nr:hypothetical protein EV12_1981 [Prochlorococcus sp. MIT 0701]KGG36115.1 hypothetical protein EV14_0523 [Prochlorococcus sp. MIT 0703]
MVLLLSGEMLGLFGELMREGRFGPITDFGAIWGQAGFVNSCAFVCGP